LDRPANTPDGSGGASRTVTASRQDDDDLMADHDQDTQSAGRTPTTPTAMPATASKDSSANGASAAEDNGHGADLPATPALPADSIGSPRDSSAFSFTRPASPAAGDAKPGQAGHAPAPAPAEQAPAPAEQAPAPAEQAPAPAEQDSTSPIDRAAFRPPPSPGSAAGAPSPTSPARPEPSPAAVSAATFAWEQTDPPPTSPSSPARSYLRSSGSTTATPSASAATAGLAAATTGQAATSPRSTSRKKATQRPVRQAHLTVARVEPWSVMKFSFVMSLVAFVILFVAVTILYGTLSALGVFESLQRVVSSVTSSQDSAGVNAARWFSASRVLGYTGLLGSLDIVLITAVATIGAVIYNLTSRLIGGVEVTLRETD
jgi:Transmembrane domain of unknown function (DUF3566)